MTGDIDRLRQYLAENESRQLEFKRATTQFDSTKLMRYCCALSCEGGGKMVFGVSDDKQVVGTQAFADPAKTEHDIHNRIGLRCTFETLQADGKRVLILHIPRSVVGHPTSYEGRYWMRSGESLAPMSPERLRELLNEGAPSYLDENEPGTHSWDEIKLLPAVERYYELIGSRMPGEETQIRDFLRMHFVERTAFDASLFYIRRLGAITLARSLNDFPDVEHHTIRVMRLRGTSITDMVFDRTYSKGYAVVFDDVIDQINALLPVNEDFADGLRDEHRDFSLVAVREIVVNACVHQDFMEHGGIDRALENIEKQHHRRAAQRTFRGHGHERTCQRRISALLPPNGQRRLPDQFLAQGTLRPVQGEDGGDLPSHRRRGRRRPHLPGPRHERISQDRTIPAVLPP